MSTTITGSSVTLTIGGTAYTAQITSAAVTRDDTQETFDVLGARVYRTVTFPYSLEMSILTDWGASSSLCQALSQAALTAPDTSLAFVLKANDGETEETVVEGSVFPEMVDATGAGFDVAEASVTLTGDRNVPLEFNPTP